MTNRPQELPDCYRYPGNKCAGECQYILADHECIHDLSNEPPSAGLFLRLVRLVLFEHRAEAAAKNAALGR